MDRNRYEISVLAKMWRRNLFGGKYEPLEKLMSDIPKKCASIYTSSKEEVREALKGEVPDYILQLR